MDALHSEIPDIPDNIRSARRNLESIPGYQLVRDLIWNSTLQRWMMHIRLTCEVDANAFVPAVTEWHVAIGQEYPDGSIKIYPDKFVGVNFTFQHQNYNKEINNQPFLSGDPCLNTTQGSWGRKYFSQEPRDESRLTWHVCRCIQWIKSAAADSLFKDGDPFELPPFPTTTPYRIVYNEDHGSLRKWSGASVKSGTVDLRTLSQNPEAYAIFNFLGHENDPPESKWGTRIASTEKQTLAGLWLLIGELPVIKPWQVPSKLSELGKVLSQQGIDLKQIALPHYRRVRRKGREARVICLGFPVPEKVGEPSALIHWFAFELPNPPAVKGFRNVDALYAHELNSLLSGDKSIKWVSTENWNKNQLTKRGLVSDLLTDANVLVIGCGAIGSILSEQLARLGVDKITVVDSQKLEAGNLSRHVLLSTEVGCYKAELLCKRLNSIFPFITSAFKNESIQDIVKSSPGFLSEFALVIDATGEESVLSFLSDALANSGKVFISISTGYNADRLFCLTYKAVDQEQSIINYFNEKSSRWLHAEKEAAEAADEVLDGIGCWHPLFPARLDDLQMLVGAAVKVIESDIKSPANRVFSVVEKQFQDGSFSGIKVIKG